MERIILEIPDEVLISLKETPSELSRDIRNYREALAKVLKQKIPSFPQKWESSLFNVLQNLWIPA